MKYPLLITVAFIWSAIPVWSQQTIDLANPGFERGLDEWDKRGDGGMSQAVPEAKHEGELGLRVSDLDAKTGSSILTKRFKVKPGKVYQARFWARLVSGDGIGVYIVFYDAQGKTFLATKEMETQYDLLPLSLPADQKEWKQWLIRKTAPAGAVEGAIWIHSYSANQSVADFDEFNLVEMAQ